MVDDSRRFNQLKSTDVDFEAGLVGGLCNEFNARGVQATRVDNLGVLPNGNSPLIVTTTLCPLYEQGNLQESRLMASGEIAESRVAVKWAEGVKVAEAADSIAKRLGRQLHVELTFADLGVINNSPTREDVVALEYHRQVYALAAEQELGGRGISWSINSYSDIAPDFPQFIHTTDGVTGEDVREIVDELSLELLQHIVFDQSVINAETGRLNKGGRRIVTSMVKSFGPELTRGLLLQYGVFDARTSRPDALNVYYERSKLLLNVTNLYPHKQLPRVDIICQ